MFCLIENVAFFVCLTKILEDDIITIWGGALGDYKYTSILGAEITLPWIEAEYIELEK